ncbi:MAG: hypothetical protein JHC83_09650 [Thermoleophilia bacterium]|nr:hypothetical protein [Thermoleophilia bacterium]
MLMTVFDTRTTAGLPGLPSARSSLKTGPVRSGSGTLSSSWANSGAIGSRRLADNILHLAQHALEFLSRDQAAAHNLGALRHLRSLDPREPGQVGDELLQLCPVERRLEVCQMAGDRRLRQLPPATLALAEI